MAGGRDGFLNELDGDFVNHLRADSAVAALIGGNSTEARIYPEMARQGASLPYITYTQAGGNFEKNLTGLDGCHNITLHVYCYSESQPSARALGTAVCLRMLPTQAVIGDGTKLHVCNGGIVDSGVDYDRASGDRKKFWTRLVLRMVISN